MPTELEELVEFLHHGNTQIRQIACENLVEYSFNAAIFKNNQFLPVRDLKLLVRDYHPIAKNALTILINLSPDEEVLDILANDDAFLETLLKKITNAKEPAADEVAILLSNLAKSDSLNRVISLKRAIPHPVSESPVAMDQLMDYFVKGTEGKLNKAANYDYLSYLFADICKHERGRKYFTTRQPYDDVVPIDKLTVFTEHRSRVRRKGVASTIKNIAFEVSSHAILLSNLEVNILPYLLLPLAGSEGFSEEDSVGMLADLQLLAPGKERESEHEIMVTHLEALLLLSTTREARDLMREVKVYPIIRECHLHVENDGVREACDRLVQVLLRDEEGEQMPKQNDLEDIEDEDSKIIDVL